MGTLGYRSRMGYPLLGNGAKKMLTKEQMSAFDVFGFLALRGMFSTEEVDAVRRELDVVLDEDRKGRPYDGGRQMVQSFVETRPLLTRLIGDDRIYVPMEQLLGPDLLWLTSDGNLYDGDTAWHHDATVKGYPQIKVALYLDPVRVVTGCLRVIPGSHELPYQHDLERLLDEEEDEPGFGVAGPEVPCFPVESDPGDVVLFNQTIWHASFGGRPGRRMLALSYMPSPKTEAHAAYLRELYKAVSNKSLNKDPFLNGDRPRLRAIVSRLKTLGLE